MKAKLFVLTLLSAPLAWGAFLNEPAVRRAYDHIALKIFTPYKYKTPISEVPEPLAAVHRESEGKRNDMRMIHHGSAALYKRLEMMDRARKSIEMEYFIYSPNKKDPAPTETPYEMSAKIVTQKLIEKAIQGVTVRLLVDYSATVFQFNPFYVSAAKNAVARGGGDPANFEVRYYNAKLTGAISSYRSHRKLLVIDDVEAITGGRNIDDKYFDLDHRYNFLDRDIWIKGSVVPVMRASFDAFWEADVNKIPKEPKRPLIRTNKANLKFDENVRKAAEFMVYTDHDRNVENKIRDLGAGLYDTSKTHSCPVTTYVTDRPLQSVFARWCLNDRICKSGGYKETHRFTERAIGEQIKKLTSEDELIVDSPYFMLNTRSGDLLRRLTENNVKITVHTNSLGSTDAVYVASAWYREVFGLVENGVKAFVHGSKSEPGYPTIDENVNKARWGTHSKTQIFGDRAFFVGTYNIDNRSSFYNAEMGIICSGSPELMADLKQNFYSRLEKAGRRILNENVTVDSLGNSVDVMGDASEKQKSLMDAIRYPVEAFQFLM